MSVSIVVKNYEHFNRALPNWNSPKGRYIRSKKQYYNELKRGGLISYEQGEKLAAEKAKVNHKLTYEELSPKARGVIQAAYSIKDGKGRIKPGDRLLKAAEEVGVRFSVSDWAPKHLRTGGFNAT